MTAAEASKDFSERPDCAKVIIQVTLPGSSCVAGALAITWSGRIREVVEVGGCPLLRLFEVQSPNAHCKRDYAPACVTGMDSPLGQPRGYDTDVLAVSRGTRAPSDAWLTGQSSARGGAGGRAVYTQQYILYIYVNTIIPHVATPKRTDVHTRFGPRTQL